MKVVDFDFEIEVEVADWFEENVVVESLDKVMDTGDIENIYHKEFSILVSKVGIETRAATMALVHSSYFLGFGYTSEC